MASRAAIVAKIARVSRQAEDPLLLLRSVAAVLREAVPFERWCGLLLDPATLLSTGGYHEEGVPLECMPRLLEIEYAEGDINAMADLARRRRAVSTLHRATAGDPTRSARFREILVPAGLGREMRAVFREQRAGAWGALVLFRPPDQPDFSDAECDLVASIGADVGRGLRRTLLTAQVARRDLPDGPGMALLSLDGAHIAVELASAAASRWLAEIPDGQLSPSGLPLAVVMLAQQAVRCVGGWAATTVRGRSGRWLTLNAEVVESERPVDALRLWLVIEPTRPHRLAEVIASAYGLTAREREVARLVVAGYSNREIASALYVSPHTVGDHLKHVFAKLNVTSRVELTSRLFFDEYLPRISGRLPVGGDGWFVDPPSRPGPGRPSDTSQGGDGAWSQASRP